ncbi:MAG TPA: DUF1801 domain-containing protein [Pyrinomonadaceae bacterium]|nr:DUF1801 domain-containing protein [Pyrinomonadaceae bacterium]
MAEAKTKPTKQTVSDFISKLPDQQTRDDCAVIAGLMEEVTKQKGVMWGTSIAGYGLTTIKYAGGREDDWPLIAFSPRKSSLTLYISASAPDKKDLLAKLGKHKVSGSCLHIKRLSDVDVPTLKKLIKLSAKKKK